MTKTKTKKTKAKDPIWKNFEHDGVNFALLNTLIAAAADLMSDISLVQRELARNTINSNKLMEVLIAQKQETIAEPPPTNPEPGRRSKEDILATNLGAIFGSQSDE
jgi:hypothetical protein